MLRCRVPKDHLSDFDPKPNSIYTRKIGKFNVSSSVLRFGECMVCLLMFLLLPYRVPSVPRTTVPYRPSSGPESFKRRVTHSTRLAVPRRWGTRSTFPFAFTAPPPKKRVPGRSLGPCRRDCDVSSLAPRVTRPRLSAGDLPVHPTGLGLRLGGVRLVHLHYSDL